MTRRCIRLQHQRSLDIYKVTHLSNRVSIKPPTVFTENSNLKLLTCYAALKAETRFATPVFDVRELLLWQAKKHVNVSCICADASNRFTRRRDESSFGERTARRRRGRGVVRRCKSRSLRPLIYQLLAEYGWQQTVSHMLYATPLMDGKNTRQDFCLIYLMEYIQTQKQTPAERNSGEWNGRKKNKLKNQDAGFAFPWAMAC